MKKFLIIVGLLIVLVVGLCETFLPRIGAGALERALRESMKTKTVTVNARTFPAFMMLFGRIGNIDIETEKGKLGDLCAEKLSLHGEGVKMPSDALLNQNFAVTDADVLTLEGVVTEQNLADFLNQQVDQLKDAKVSITKEKVIADAKMGFSGLTADVHAEGTFFIEDNTICLRMTNVTVKKLFFGRDLTANLIDRIDLYDFNQLNMPVELDEAIHEDGQVRLKASRHPGKTYGDGRKKSTKGENK